MEASAGPRSSASPLPTAMESRTGPMHRAYSGEEGSPFRMVYTAQVMMSSRFTTSKPNMRNATSSVVYCCPNSDGSRNTTVSAGKSTWQICRMSKPFERNSSRATTKRAAVANPTSTAAPPELWAGSMPAMSFHEKPRMLTQSTGRHRSPTARLRAGRVRGAVASASISARLF